MIQNLLKELTIKYALSPSTVFLLELAVSIAKCLVIIAIWFFISALLRRAIKKALYSSKRRFSERKIGTIYAIISSVIKYGVYFIAICQVLSIFGIGMQSILAVAGVGGVAIGFGAQSIVKDFMTGLLILLEDQFGVGDTVSINGMTGVCESIGMRTTRLRGEDGNLYIIPNNVIAVVTQVNVKSEE